MRSGPVGWLANHRSPWLLALLGLLGAYGLARASVAQFLGADLDVYLTGAMALVRGDGSLYRNVIHGELPFTYPPFAAAMFVPLTWLPPAVAKVAFTAGSVAALAFVLWVFGRRTGSAVAGVIVPLTVVVLASEPLLRNLSLGQINLYLIAMVTADLLVVPPRYRGLLTGLAAGIKLTPGIFLLQFALRRDWPSLARGVAALAATVAAGWWADPSGSRDYLSGGALGLGRFGLVAVVRPDNQSLTGVLLRAIHATTVPTAVQVAVLVVPVAIGAWIAHRRLVAGDELGAFAALAIAGLLGSPVSWTHHWLWVVPALAWAWAGRRWAFWVVATVVVVAPMWLVGQSGPALLRLGPGEQIVAAGYVAAGVLLLAVLAGSGSRSLEMLAAPGRPR